MKAGETVDLCEFRDLLQCALKIDSVKSSVSKAVLQHWSHEGIEVPFHVLPGGKAPKRASKGAVGFDLYARAIVDSNTMDPNNPNLRQTLFDFVQYPTDEKLRAHVHTETDVDTEGRVTRRSLSYRLGPGEHVLVGVGVAFELPYELFQWLAPRSGLATKHRIQLANAPGTVDSDYRGEAGLIVVNEGKHDFLLGHHMRIAQMLFQPVIIPKLVEVTDYDDLGKTERGAGGFGSTGFHALPETK